MGDNTVGFFARRVKLEFHDADTDTDILARILADTSDTRDFLKLFLWQAERHADILATILARVSVSVSVSVSASWNASLIVHRTRSNRRRRRYCSNCTVVQRFVQQIYRKSNQWSIVVFYRGVAALE